MSSSYSSFRPLIALVLFLPSVLTQDTPTCADLSENLAFNASSSRNMTGFQLHYLGGDPMEILIREDDSKTWTFSSYIHHAGPGIMDPNSTQATLWLDTGSTDRERLGETMGMCHSYMLVQLGGNITMSKDVLERSLEDEGDCKKMLGEECVQALEKHYRNQAGLAWSVGGDCREMEDALPAECEGLVAPITITAPPFNGSFPTRMPNLWNYSSNIATPACDSLPVNLNQSYGTWIQNVVDYDIALNFPVVDILSFFPMVNRSEYQIPSSRATDARLMCLRPEGAAQGSRQARTAREVLDGMGKGGGGEDGGSGDGESGAARLGGKGVVGLVVAMGLMVVLNM